ncbi:MAG TPA: alanine racemase [Blastocatellia bacterium]|nr:alanine racemase [Blastocatellia bacterium]
MAHNPDSSGCRYEAQALEELKQTTLDQTTKGLPFGARTSPAQSRSRGWKILRGDLPFPLLVIKESALEHNLTEMADWCGENGLWLAPHVKTTMSPQIFERQIAKGAWALTVANLSQVQVCLTFGVSRIVIANQVAGAANLRALTSLLNEHPNLECYCLVDSVAGVKHLAGGLEQYGAQRPINVLLEWGHQGWRTGVRSIELGLEVCREAALHSRFLKLQGVEAFEGSVSAPEGGDEEARQVDQFLEGLQTLGRQVRASWPELELPLLSMGGSAFLDRVLRAALRVRGEFRTVIRSGCYVTHDHVQYERKQAASLARAAGQWRVPQFIPALELWSYVQSVPEEGLALLTFGKRDAPHDLELPVPLFALSEGRPLDAARPLAGSRVFKLNDQHAYLALDRDQQVQVGDLVCAGISHPCTAFDKWRAIPVVNDDYEVVDLYRTFF